MIKNEKDKVSEDIFNKMSELTITSYHQLQTDVIKDIVHLRDQTTYLLFGLSGAGKSTLLARLACDDSVKEFNDLVEKSKKERVVVNHITFGGGMNAVTTVPQKVDIGGMGPTFDMPGLRDSDPTRKPVVSILQRCLYQNLSRAKFIVVMSANVFELREGGNNALTNDYHAEMLNLFGTNFTTYINSCYFVITQADRYPDIVSKLSETFNRLFREANRNNSEHLGKFVDRIYDHHCIINYDKDDKKDISDKLERLLKGGGEPMPPRSLNTDRMHDEGNQLKMQCMIRLTECAENLENKHEPRLRDHQIELDEIEKSVTGLEKTRTKYVDALKEIEACKKTIKDNEVEMNLRKEKLAEFKASEENVKLQATQFVKQKEEFLTLAGNLNSPEMMAFMSVETTGKTLIGTKKYEEISIIIPKPPGILSEPVIIALEPEQFNTFKYAFKGKTSFAEATDTGTMSALYNNKTSSKAAGFEIEHPNTPDGLSIRAKASFKFVIAYLYEAHLADTNKSKTLGFFYDGLQKDAQQRAAEIEASIKTLTAQIANLVKDCQLKKERIEALKLELPLTKAAFNDAQNLALNHASGLKGRVLTMQSEVDMTYISGDSMQKIKRVGEIFVENRLGSEVNGQVILINGRAGALINRWKELLHKLEEKEIKSREISLPEKV
jgi:signal recognition particle GTPase